MLTAVQQREEEDEGPNGATVHLLIFLGLSLRMCVCIVAIWSEDVIQIVDVE